MGTRSGLPSILLAREVAHADQEELVVGLDTRLHEAGIVRRQALDRLAWSLPVPDADEIAALPRDVARRSGRLCVHRPAEYGSVSTRRAVFILFVVAATLAVAPSVTAQTPGGGLLVVRACGANGCKAIFNGLFLVDPNAAAAEATGAPPVGPFYVLEPSNYRAKEQTEEASGPTTPAFFVPGAAVVRARPDAGQLTEQEWIRLPDAKRAALMAALRGVEPFPAPRISKVLIAGRTAGDPESYLGLYAALPAVAEPSFSARGQPVAIALRSETPSPWTDGHNRVAYYPDVHLLFRDGEWVRPSADLIERIEHPAMPGSGVPWDRIAGTAGPVVVLAAIGLLWFLGRRRGTKLEATARV